MRCMRFLSRKQDIAVLSDNYFCQLRLIRRGLFFHLLECHRQQKTAIAGGATELIAPDLFLADGKALHPDQSKSNAGLKFTASS